MKKLIAVLLVVLGLTGCTSTSIHDKAQDVDSRFKILSSSNINSNRYIAILEDKETGCKYMYAYAENNSIGTALTPLLDKHGVADCSKFSN
ncbi:DUF6440 family protein [Paenibacillus polymyxa]|uniref:DUF6440 domain-containing protein n=1 Tax=Paenibacillus polymyxa TaxID=1406 RepID=A0ABX2ZBK7_PAEPO|nr:DUF6440 family protein [Paenibacillus polymyxa]ODA08211.1 hypothetical protein A7312_28010 [Paenibacillus polymyxa]